MSILSGKGLTEVPFDKMAKQSFAGMAHFAGTGPSGKRCGECSNFCGYPISDGTPDKDYCDKYQQMMGKPGKRIPKEAQACKYFTPRKKVKIA
jgi:hypothetical protein